AIHSRLLRQRSELAERGGHLLGRALEQSAAAAAEQRVAAEHRAMAHVGDVSGGMAGHVQHLERQSELIEAYAVAFAQAHRLAGYFLACRAEQRNVAERGRLGCRTRPT